MTVKEFVSVFLTNNEKIKLSLDNTIIFDGILEELYCLDNVDNLAVNKIIASNNSICILCIEK